ncbi:MAG: histidinol-phosphatase HisJ family protein [Candidatus Cloacimonetes bacterium]|nr:histidinol-phosphatase HisJ family protein [Candidatus Cloacimonadota bacterium]
MKIDYHIHSMYSADSDLEMQAVISKAIERSYDEIAFTDHFDLLSSEIAVWGIPSYQKYSEAVSFLKNQNLSISILKGVELGEYHRCHTIVDEVLKTTEEPDLKIASIHVLPEGSNISVPLTVEITPEFIRTYYLENLALVEYGNFDILGHLGIYKRYLPHEPDEKQVLELIKEILSLLIKKSIALEVNLSGMRNSYRKLIPVPEYLTLFKSMGGELITIGSDSHKIEHFDSHYEEALQQLLDCGFTHQARKTPSGWTMEKIQV